jgi:hypothetical protein
VTVNPVNDAPSAIIQGVPLAPPPEGFTISLAGTQTDVDSSAWTYQWSVVASNGQVINPGSNQTFNFAPDENGTYTVTLVVTDNGSGPSAPLTGNAVAIITVDNAAPVPSPAGPYSVFSSSIVRLFASSTDAGTRDTVSYLWDLDNDGVFGETGTAAKRGNENVANPFFVAPNLNYFKIRNVFLQATDDDGGSSVASTTVSIFPQSSRYDFNAASVATEANYLSVRGSTLFNMTRGYGWANAATEFDNFGPTALLRDGHTGTDNTFSLRVIPNVTYQVTLSFRDVVDRKGFDVFAEGALRASNLQLIGANRVSDLVPGGFNTTLTVRFDVVSTDGILDLRFRGRASGSPQFVVNGLQLLKK